MSKGTPSLMALLGLVAVAGYKNRGKLSEMMGHAQGTNAQGGMGSASGPSGGGLLAELGGMFGLGQGGQGSLAGTGGMSSDPSHQQTGSLTGGLSDLMDKFRGSGMGQKADSWVADGDNHQVEPHELETALGADMVAELTQKTGLSRDDLLSRLSQALPDTVNRFTPAGRLPTDEEAREFY